MQLKRQLFVIAIVHDQADLGSLATLARCCASPQAWHDRQSAIEAWWDIAEHWSRDFIDGATQEKTISQVVVFQDGLAADVPAEKVVCELARSESRNYQVLEQFLKAGAQVVGTESAELLVRELEFSRLFAGASPASLHLESQGRALLERRDHFIAQKVASTLREGQQGILFVGSAHHVESFLPTDIEVVRPVRAMPLRALRSAS